MNDKERAHFESLLLDERRRIARTLARIEATAPALSSSGGDWHFGDDPSSGAMGASETYDVAMMLHQTAALEEIDDALRRIKEAPTRFGLCDKCGKPIAAGRLEIVPATRFCQLHSRG
ncbi:MAG: TraR/DksA C4-type zinc finger protein [Gemmatimonadaceae bacterium]